ncbi:dUTP diphosphatase [Candidatus Nomurabacteria bacterium]|jgi:dUTP pyrophosphatase|nr:dUTP diphosphatase [Candidatus Saccharibacteria bacterium]MCB9839953.1 dUTP diphosphatase [Candidatus Nomurabacteria bacterium]
MNIIFKKLSDRAQIPRYQTEMSAGMDIAACLEKPLVLKQFARVVVPTGLAVEVPVGYEVQVRARSGLAAKHGISLVNGVGTIDADYRGELGVILINLGSEDFVINNGERIAQIVVIKIEQPKIIEQNKLSKTNRDINGFGSTGK